MKLLLPVVSPDDIQLLRTEIPYTEFYAGIELSSWYDRFGNYEDLNRMSAFRKTANMEGLGAVGSLKNVCGENELYVTLNAGCYSLEQQTFLADVIAALAEMKVTGIIVGDPYLVRTVLENGLKPVASTMVGIYNADMARWCKECGFQRLILPRDLSLNDIACIIDDVPDIEYECFLMRNGCRYSDSNCLARHSDRYGAICTGLDRSKTVFGGAATKSFAAHDAMSFNHQAFSRVFHKEACGMCAIWDLIQMGVTAGKVVGRADGVQSIFKDALLLQQNILIAEECYTREEYLSKMSYPENYDSFCFQGCNCYYPEARYKNIEEK